MRKPEDFCPHRIYSIIEETAYSTRRMGREQKPEGCTKAQGQVERESRTQRCSWHISKSF